MVSTSAKFIKGGVLIHDGPHRRERTPGPSLCETKIEVQDAIVLEPELYSDAIVVVQSPVISLEPVVQEA